MRTESPLASYTNQGSKYFSLQTQSDNTGKLPGSVGGNLSPDAHTDSPAHLTLVSATHLVVDSGQLVVKGHGQVSRCARGHVCDERCFALVHCVIHIHPALADLHVLETRFDTVHAKGGGRDPRQEGG